MRQALAGGMTTILWLGNSNHNTRNMKLWEKNYSVNAEIERFTVGRDREMDLYLAKYDVLGSMAHITMLNSIGLIGDDELPPLLRELRNIYTICESGEFVIEDDIEDVHSQVELMLTRKLGDMGKKIHSGRSRNDQVLVDLKLFTRDALRNIVNETKSLFDELISKSEKYKHVLMPGYTHTTLWLAVATIAGKHHKVVIEPLGTCPKEWYRVGYAPIHHRLAIDIAYRRHKGQTA